MGVSFTMDWATSSLTRAGLATRQEMADRHIIYRGRHISTELLTFMRDDYSQPRLMTLQERRDLLKEIFKASGW